MSRRNYSHASRRASGAIRQFREAVRRGLKDGDFLKKTEELDALRDRENFKALLRKLQG